MKKRIIATMLAATLLTTLASCGKKSDEEYSIGLTPQGYYQHLSDYDIKLPKFEELQIECDDVLEWGVKYMQQTKEDSIKNVDDYIYKFGEEYAAVLGLTNKEKVEEGDVVAAYLEFYIDDKKLEDFTSERNYEVTKEGDSIVKSMLGHKKGDKYETKYTFPKEEKEVGGKEAKVKVEIKNVSLGKPLEKKVIENNLDKVNKELKNVKDLKSYLTILRPKLAETILEGYLETYIQELDIEVPSEYVNYEMSRFKHRLSQLNLTYKEYLKKANTTSKEVEDYCALVAKENYILLKYFPKIKIEISDKDLKDYYGESYEYTKEVQGEPYMRLKMMRDGALFDIADKVKLVDKGKVIERTLKPNIDLSNKNTPKEKS